LLVAVEPAHAADFQAVAQQEGLALEALGEVVTKGNRSIEVR